ncbi:IPExxxVDY family protein [Aureibacter tunicatorum]|uniref:IPExxxVDY family protein n=1 Tax=Aureibacter tunicatorum TaxID=866807 RepID=A0AAE3XRY7_9BACT|nr:IPExxxVDY family protein [Aureibacter tunicatorum]MDR6240870.1 hypothetical protein [Aureibacter tunicatorum]BDD03650.1 hypothetical protein AUTU_11330 [Aureibacter tunicatorum]
MIDENYKLIGIVTDLKDYKLAWNINQETYLKLIKTQDFSSQTEEKPFSFSRFKHMDDRSVVTLVKNKSYSSDEGSKFLLHDLRQFNFFMLIDGWVSEEKLNNFISQLKQNSSINFIKILDLSKINSQEILIV